MKTPAPLVFNGGEWLGTYALPFFFAGLLGVTVIVGLAVWAIQRNAWTNALLIRLAILVFAIAASLFAVIAGGIGVDRPEALLDQSLSTAVGLHTSGGVLQVFRWITDLGDPKLLTVWCVIFGIILIARREYVLAGGWVIAIAGNATLNRVLKATFERARPIHEQAFHAQGWSFPSGHTSGAIVTYGMLAYLAVHYLPAKWHATVMMIAAALVFTIGCSRIFLQLHYLSDVLAGWATGIAWLTLCITATELLYRRYNGRASPKI
ncbi:MAG: phosphatase PAP2 family protein [Pseudomonadota bacterium]